MTVKKENNSNFEAELFHALKAYGYLFPTDNKSVERFDVLYGNTSIEIPSNIEMHMDKKKGVDITDIDLSLFSGIAAYSSDQTNDSLLDTDNNTEELEDE